MFIVCPSCSGPYRIPADQIAPLVQVACPHCEYKVILDFEAANDPALREPGHQFAQGYENAEAYFSVYSHVGKQPNAVPFESPGIAAGKAPAEAQKATGTSGPPPAKPEAKPTTTPPTTPPTTPVAAQQPAQQPSSGLLGAASSGASMRGAKTVMHTPSKKPVAMDPSSEPLAPRPKAPSGPTMHAGPGTEAVKPAEPTTIPPTDTGADRKPPHTPPVANVVSSGPTTPEVAPTKPAEDPAAQSNTQLSAGEKKPEPVTPVETKQPEKAPERPVVPTETSSAKWILLGILLLVGVVLVVLYFVNKP